MRISVAVGILLIVIGIFPAILPTTYFRISPLAKPVRDYQCTKTSLGQCEVCGDDASADVRKPCTLMLDFAGNPVGYNPREWPGNAFVMVCANHAQYADKAVAKRLGYQCLTLLLIHGDNPWLRIVFFVHLCVLVAGVIVLWRYNMKREAKENE